MEKLDSPETLIALYKTARLHVTEYRRNALKIHNMWKLYLNLVQHARLRVKFLMLFYDAYLVVNTWNNRLYADNVKLGWW